MQGGFQHGVQAACSLGIQPRVKSLRSGDTTPSRMTGVTLHGVVSPDAPGGMAG